MAQFSGATGANGRAPIVRGAVQAANKGGDNRPAAQPPALPVKSARVNARAAYVQLGEVEREVEQLNASMGVGSTGAPAVPPRSASQAPAPLPKDVPVQDYPRDQQSDLPQRPRGFDVFAANARAEQQRAARELEQELEEAGFLLTDTDISPDAGKRSNGATNENGGHQAPGWRSSHPAYGPVPVAGAPERSYALPTSDAAKAAADMSAADIADLMKGLDSQ